MATRVVQLRHPQHGRRVARVDEPRLRLLATHRSVYDAARAAIASGQRLESLIDRDATGESLDYDAIYASQSDWRLLPPFDHPTEQGRCFITGTGLTHQASEIGRPAWRERGEGWAGAGW